MIAAWWATLYVGYVTSVRLQTLPVIVIGSAVWVSLTTWGPWREVYRELGEIVTGGKLLYEIGWGSMIYGSPILVNEVVLYVQARVKRSGISAADPSKDA